MATAWSERAALLGRSYPAMEGAFRLILARLPFPVLELHPDNGSEFFNTYLLRFWGKVFPGVQLSRSPDTLDSGCIGAQPSLPQE